MTKFGYTLMTEQSGPRELVRYAVAAEAAGFDFEVSSDHYFPWLTSMGHSPYAWTVLGAVAQVTERVELMTYVTCPTMRYHPAVVAQKAATLGLLSDNRFLLGLGSGENLNEHAVGAAWPSARVRQDMLVEAITIIRELHRGEQISWAGEHFAIDSAKIWDLPEQPIEIGLAVSGESSVEKFAPLADHLIAGEPDLRRSAPRSRGTTKIRVLNRRSRGLRVRQVHARPRGAFRPAARRTAGRCLRCP